MEGALVLEKHARILFTALLLAVFCVALASSSATSKPGKNARATDENERPKGPHAAGELVVTYEDGSSRTTPESLGETAAVEEELPEIGARVVEFKDVKDEPTEEARETKLADRKKELEKKPNVATVDYNYKRTLSYTANDPGLRDQWALGKAGFERAWNGERGEGAKIAILDTGVAAGHPDLKGKISAQWDFLENDRVADDPNGHGTAVAGIAAALTDDGAGIAGACPDCKLVVAKVMGGNGVGYDSDIAQAITWSVDNDADVVNLSLGGQAESAVLKQAVDYAAKKGVVIVAAAGNRGENSREYPTAYPSVVAVASTDQGDVRAPDSNFGSWVDVAAPGVEIVSTVPEGYGLWSGTSMAAPHVAALAALFAADGAENVEDRISKTADDLGRRGSDAYYGAGRIDAGSLAANGNPSGKSDKAANESDRVSLADDKLPQENVGRTRAPSVDDTRQKTVSKKDKSPQPSAQGSGGTNSTNAGTGSTGSTNTGTGSTGSPDDNAGKASRGITELPDTGGPSPALFAGVALVLSGMVAFHASRYPRSVRVVSRRLIDFLRATDKYAGGEYQGTAQYYLYGGDKEAHAEVTIADVGDDE